LITSQMIDQIKGLFGLIMTLASIALVVFKWFKAPTDDEDGGDKEKGDAPSAGDHMDNISSSLSKLE